MTPYDPGAADQVVVKVIGALGGIALAALGIWQRFYRTRKNVSADNGERTRFQDAIDDAREARREAHDANNAVMEVQRQLGRYESENKACNRRTRLQAVRIGRLERQNADQATQIGNLARALKARFDPSASDLG